MARLYWQVNSPEDIRRINCIIRDEMLIVNSIEELTELKKRSDYLCTLTYSPFWKKKFNSLIEQLRQVALEENRITVRLANYIAKYKWWDKQYDPWGEDNKTIEEKLKELPEEIIKELTETTINLKLSPEILEDIRKSFCKIRAAMVLVNDEDELIRLKNQSNIIVAIIKTDDFINRFKDLIEDIEELVKKEEERTINLANIIATVNWWKIEFEKWSEDELYDDESLEEYINRLMEEEVKSEIYIPSEAKYKRWARTIWIIYKHPKRDRYYAKRVYIPESSRNIKFEWPGYFENRFKRKVYGIRIEYEVYVKSTTIHRWNITIHLPERWIKRYKVVELPEWVKEIEIKDVRPEFAYPVA